MLIYVHFFRLTSLSLPLSLSLPSFGDELELTDHCAQEQICFVENLFYLWINLWKPIPHTKMLNDDEQHRTSTGLSIVPEYAGQRTTLVLCVK